MPYSTFKFFPTYYLVIHQVNSVRKLEMYYFYFINKEQKQIKTKLFA